MHLTLHKIRWKNFLGTGNSFTEITLDTAASTLIIGKNGSGKSTLIDALFFALFGRPYRKINKPQLINSINKKQMLVELEFSIKDKSYLIKRGLKPNIFEIFESDKLLNQDAGITDYQSFLEKNIIGMNRKTCAQIAILGSSSYVPFMQLDPAKRRDVIEDLLDIQVFSVMNVILKEKISKNKDEIVDVETKLKIINEKIILQKKHIEELKKNSEKTIEENNDKVKQLLINVDNNNLEIENIQNEISKLNEHLHKNAKEKLKLFNSELDKLQTKKQQLHSDLQFFNENDICPTCRQDIDEQFKTNALHEKKLSLTQFEDYINEISIRIKTINEQIEFNDNINNDIWKLQEQINHNTMENSVMFKTIKHLQEDNEKMLEKNISTSNNNVDLKKFEKELKLVIKEKTKLLDEKQLLDISYILLKDDGIKSRIIKQYIPIINKLINRYLSEMDFFVQFEINENFEEKINSRFRDEFTYYSFSEGQKARIDLAILFAWRTVAKMRNSASCNCLFLDEVFDGSLDLDGSDEITKILQEISGDSNIFVISHTKESMIDRFERLITFKLEKNFSIME
jgi:DNA repair exonuclease SbcCD ATPase subunit